jgi:choline-sulfatase
MSKKHPNILCIMADQLAAPALPFYGHPIVKTPHLSALAEEGVIFENAYCNSPLCAPSRFSMLTGKLPSQIGAYDNGAHFPADIPTFAHYLRDFGYHTCLAGKMHFVGPDQLHGFEERLTTDIYPSDFGWTPDWEHFAGRPTWYHDMMSVVQAGLCEASNQLDFDEEVAFQSQRKLYNLSRHTNEQPFFMTVSFTHPHDPFAITQDFWNRYNPKDIDMPAVPPIPYNRLDPHSQRLYHICAMGEYAQTEERVRNARHAYYAMISYIDDKVGQLLQTLKNSGLRDDTIILFISDHGEMLGERGLWYKMSFFEWSARVPMIFHAPGRFAPRRVHQPVSLVDLLPTITEIALNGQSPTYSDSLDGQSLLPLLDGKKVEKSGIVYGEMLCEGAVSPLLMIRRDRYKYVYSKPDPEQLFDLENDPNEMYNLADQPEFQDLRRDFHAELLQHWDIETLHREVVESQHRRQLVYRALRSGRHTPWDFQPYQDASRLYMRNHLDLGALERSSRYPSLEIPPPDGPAGLDM